MDDTPDDLVFELHTETLWPDHPYGYSILGTPETRRRALGRRPPRAAPDGLLPRATAWSRPRATSTTTRCSRCCEREGWFEGTARERARRPVAAGAGARGACRGGRSGTRRRPTSSSAPTPSRSRDPRRFALAILANVFGGGMSAGSSSGCARSWGSPTRSTPTRPSTRAPGQLGVYVGTQTASARPGGGRDPRGVRPAGARGSAARTSWPTASSSSRARSCSRWRARSRGWTGSPASACTTTRTARSTRCSREIDAVTRGRGRRGGGGVLPAGAADGGAAGTSTERSVRANVKRDQSLTLRFTLHAFDRLHSERGPMLIGVPKEIKTNENRIALVPAGAEALVARGPHGAHRAGRRAGQRLPRRGVHRRRREDPAHGRRGVARGRDDHEGEGADRGRVAAHARRGR